MSELTECQKLVNELLDYHITDKRIDEIKKRITKIYTSKVKNDNGELLKWHEALEFRKIEHKQGMLNPINQANIVQICQLMGE